MAKNSNKPLPILADLMGPAWSEIELTPGGLVVPGWRKPFEPEELRSMFFRCQQVAILEAENARLRRERAEAWALAEAEKEKAAYYRRLVVEESRLGLALLRITSDA